MQTRLKLVIGSSVGLIISFFMPWLQAFGEGASAQKISSLGGSAVALWIIPLSGAVAIFLNYLGGSERQKHGLTFLCSFVALGGIFWALASAGKLAGDYTFDLLGIGFYISFASALGLMAALFVGPYDTDAKAIATDSDGIPQSRATVQDTLAELTKIRSAGLITEDEFKAKRADIIDQIGRA